jgi:hypothetical protein
MASTSSCRTGASARYGRLDPIVDYGANAAYLAASSFDPQRYSVMLDYAVGVQPLQRAVQQSRLRPPTSPTTSLPIHLDLGAWRPQVLKVHHETASESIGVSCSP